MLPRPPEDRARRNGAIGGNTIDPSRASLNHPARPQERLLTAFLDAAEGHDEKLPGNRVHPDRAGCDRDRILADASSLPFHPACRHPLSCRGKGNILPIKKIAGIYKRTEEKTTDKKNKLVYILAAPVYTIDLLFRYFFRIVPKRMEKKIVITDRYGSDVLLMKHVPLWFKKVLFSLFPKPTLAFYLYNDPEVLYERRKQQSPEELQRQMELFGHLVKKFQALPIKTNDPEQDSQMIAQRTFTYLFQNRY